MNLFALGGFLAAALLLLGSPGPGIAGLVAAARRDGFAASLPFYGGLQAGLALAAGLCAAGLASLLLAAPWASRVMGWAAALYLVYLAWRVASAPVGRAGASEARPAASGVLGGFMLGLTNPKAYLAFGSLMATYGLIRDHPPADAALKWAICVAVAAVVDIAWLWFGGALRAIRPGLGAERAINVAMGCALLAAAILALA